MNLIELGNYFFGTTEGVIWLVVIVLIITLILAVLFERRIKRRYVDRGFKHPEDDWNNPANNDDYDE